MKRNVTGQNIDCQMNSRTDGSPLTTSVSVFVTGDNGTRTAGAGTLTHKSDGQWNYAPTQAETNYDHIAFQFVHATGVNVVLNVYTTFPQTGDNFARLGAPTLASIAADIQSRSSHTAADVWAVGTRTLTSFGTLVSDIWNNATRTLTSFGTLAADVWASTTRTLSAFGFDVTVATNNDKTGYTVSTVSDKTGYSLSSAAEDAIVDKTWDELRSAHLVAGSFGEGAASVQGNVTGSVASVTAAVTVGTNNDKTGYGLADDALTELKGTAGFFNRIADHVLRRNHGNARTSSYGDAISFRSLLGAGAKLYNKWSISGTTLTVTHEDDVTSFATQTLTTSGTAEAVTGVDTN
jgi:hypothetical protein